MKWQSQNVYLRQSVIAMTPYFTQRIESPYGYINFYFNRIYTVDGVRYHISCKDVKGRSYAFEVMELVGHWIISHTSKCPLWIKKLEPQFEKAISKSLAK
jgi:hypothetical protein